MPERNRRILCVDDNDDLLVMLSYVLAARGYDVELAPSGADALQMLAEKDFAAVVLDYHMPVMDGEAVALRIRETRPDQPIVLFSASGYELPHKLRNLVNVMVSKSEPLAKLVDEVDKLTLQPPERRKWPRRLLKASVAVTSIADQPVIALATATDLSSGGIAIAAPLKIDEGETVSLEFSMPAGTAVIKADAEVRYRSGDRIGLAFRVLKEEDRDLVQRFATEGEPGNNGEDLNAR
jgi:CheY-like chemotaxis protein